MACFSPVAGILLIETQIHGSSNCRGPAGFSPVAGILLIETQVFITHSFLKPAMFQSRCRDSVN